MTVIMTAIPPGEICFHLVRPDVCRPRNEPRWA